MATTSHRPRPRPIRHRLAMGGLRLANRLSPKTESEILLFSVPDLEDGVLAVAGALVDRGWKPTFLLADAANARAVMKRVPGPVEVLKKDKVHAVRRYLRAG